MNGAWLRLAVSLVTIAGTSAAAAPPRETLASVPFVGCSSDGQVGPRPAPKQVRSTPKLESSIARKLVFYAGQDLGVLAPRGWHCLELYGSSGSTLIVTPKQHDQDLFEWKNKIKTDAVELVLTLGGTSGRFEVADVGARLFPLTRPLVRRVRGEGIIPVKPVEVTKGDRILSQSTTRVEFSTDAGSRGLGTRSRLGPTSDSITGALILVPNEDFDLVTLNVRLRSSQHQLASAIVHATETDRGNPRHEPWTGEDHTGR